MSKVNNIFFTILKCLWPIERDEVQRFLPMALMMLCVLFNYNVLRALKDSLVVPGIGAEALGFVKLYCVVPIAVIVMVIYAKMTNVMRQQTIFYTMAMSFLIFFLLFSFVLYPYQDQLHPNPETINELSSGTVRILGGEVHMIHFRWFFNVYAKWTYALFYVVAELWGSVMLSLLFWQFANQITKIEQAKRFYPMYGFIGNIGLVLAGYLLKNFAQLDTGTNSQLLISSITWAMVFAIVLIMFFYNHMNVRVLHSSERAEDRYVKAHSKISLLESFKVILSSKYLGFIVILLFSYGITINIIEGPWKARVRELYPSTASYAHFMGTLTQSTGVVSMLAMIIGANVLRRVTWFSGAILTPLVLFFSGIGFFSFVVFDSYIYKKFGEFILLNPLVIAVFFGMLQNILSKATKYSFFDPTKEMAYIPIDRELKTKGKAAVDIVGARLAKALGALLQSSLFIIFPAATYVTITPYLMVVFIIIAIIWMVDVKMLYGEYKSFFGSKDKSNK